MYKQLLSLILSGLKKQVPASGLGVFRICFGLVILQEVIFLFFFRHLIFDRTPYLDPASILVPGCLFLWGLTASFLIVGYYTRFAAVANYIFWLGFVCFTPMRQDFDGGFDQLMTGSSFLLMFLPTERALSIDNLRYKLKFSTINYQYIPPQLTSVLSYYIPIVLSVGVLYFDAAIHKLSAEHWRNGMGAWLPSSLPYYMSAIDMTWLLNNKPIQLFVGYILIVYQFSFVFLCYVRKARVPLMLIGIAFHTGIIISLNIYPFGFGMLVHFVLMTPFAWWRFIRGSLSLKQSVLTVFYDQQSPVHNRTVIVIQHFDFLKAVEFKSVQEYAEQYRELDTLSYDQLIKDMFSLDNKGRLCSGLDTYVQIFLNMKYTAILGFFMKIPGFYHIGTRIYRNRTDTGNQLVCDKNRTTFGELPYRAGRFETLYRRCAGTPSKSTILVAKFLIIYCILQMNSTIRYGVLWRVGVDMKGSEIGKNLTLVSDLSMLFSHLFFGISPHALYLHDHLNGYNHILAFTYSDKSGAQKWLPFVNEEGRIIAPNWGRVQSMWANIAVRPNINRDRLYKFTEKVTAFWGTKIGLDLSDTEFSIKLKEIRVPMHWEVDLRNKNLTQPWTDIGKVVWKNETVSIDIPNIDIEAL